MVFEMHVLFEVYVVRLMRRVLIGAALRVTAQGGGRDCLFEGESGRFRTRPDLIVRQGEQIALMIDTRWKRIAPRIDAAKQGVAQAGVDQLMAYGQLSASPRVMLLYPHHAGLTEGSLCERSAIARPEAAETLTLATLDLTQPVPSQRDAVRDRVLKVTTPDMTPAAAGGVACEAP